jgi:hypothetical protein
MELAKLQEVLAAHTRWVSGLPSGHRANLGGANLRDAYLRDANLRDAYLRDACLSGANLRGVNLCGADLCGADLGGAYLHGANLCGAYLHGADLGGTDLGGADLRGANLGGAYLRGANLGGAYLRDANLGSADLRDANLGSADLGGANLRGARYSSGTNWPAPTMLLLVAWGSVTPALCTAMMRLDAACHPDPSAFDRWASSERAPCPYEGVVWGRAANFQEFRSLWSPGSARPWDVVQQLLHTYLVRAD